MSGGEALIPTTTALIPYRPLPDQNAFGPDDDKFKYTYTDLDDLGSKSVMPSEMEPLTKAKVIEKLHTLDYHHYYTVIYNVIEIVFSSNHIFDIVERAYDRNNAKYKNILTTLFPTIPLDGNKDEYRTKLNKLIGGLAELSLLYYIPCKHEVPSLTRTEFALAFISYYITAKGRTWGFKLSEAIKTITTKNPANKINMNNVSRCQICLTSFDELSPDYSLGPKKLTRTLLINYGGRHRKSRKIRKSKRGKRKGIKQKSRRSISR